MTDGTEVHARIQAASKVFAALKDNIFATRDARLQVKAKVYKATSLIVLCRDMGYHSKDEKNAEFMASQECPDHVQSDNVASQTASYHNGILVARHGTQVNRAVHHDTESQVGRACCKNAIHQSTASIPHIMGTEFKAHKTYGHTLEDHLKMAGLPAEAERWHKLAQDRVKWRKLIGAKPDRVGIRVTAVPHTHNYCNAIASQEGRVLRPHRWIRGQNLRTIA